MSLDRLSHEDARILALERGVIAGHTLKVVVLEAPLGGALPGLAEVRAQIQARLPRAPRLRQRLAPTPLRLAPPAWVDDERFDIARHVRRAQAEGEVDQQGLRALVADAMRERLDRAHPLWTLDVVEHLEGGRAALIWKLHHCMADGQTAMALGDAVLWSSGVDRSDPAAVGWRPAPTPGRVALAVLGARERAGRMRARAGGPHLHQAKSHATTGLLARELRPTRERSPLDQRLSTQRTVACAAVALDTIKAIERSAATRVTVNDVVLAAVAGALRRWLEHHHGRLDDLRVKVPVSLHHDGHATCGANRDSFLCASLPLGEADGRTRLERIAAQTAERKRDHDPEAIDALFTGLRRASPALERFADRLASSPRVFALNVSNVRGPTGPRTVAGASLTRLYSVAEIGPHHALRISVISLGDILQFGLCADPSVVSDLDVLAAAIGSELEALAAGC